MIKIRGLAGVRITRGLIDKSIRLEQSSMLATPISSKLLSVICMKSDFEIKHVVFLEGRNLLFPVPKHVLHKKWLKIALFCPCCWGVFLFIFTWVAHDGAKTRQDHAKTRQDPLRSRQDAPRSRQDRAKTRQDRAKTRQDRAKTRQNRAKMRQDRAKTRQNC